MNDLNSTNNAQQRSAVSPIRVNNNVPTPQAFSGQIAAQHQQPQFNATVLQLLTQIIQQLLQLISDQQPDQPEPPQEQPLNPDDATRAKLADLLGVPANTIKVTDRDGNGQLSAGDLVEGATEDDIGNDVPVRYELTDLALRDINGELGRELPVSNDIRQPLHEVLGIGNGSQPQFIGKVFDNDGNGKLSAGDVVSFTGIGIPPFSTDYVELTAEQVQQFENKAYGADLGLPEQDLSRLTTILRSGGAFGLGGPPIVQRAFDTDGDGQLSAGDTLELKQFDDSTRPDSPFRIITLEVTQEVADQFNQSTNNPPANANVSVGVSFDGEPIPGDRVVAINGQNYAVDFLKQQVDGYAASSFSRLPDGVAVGQVTEQTPWGGSSLSYFAGQFEAYVSETFPAGDPDVPRNAPVRYERSVENRNLTLLVVNGQAYAPHLNETQFGGRVDSLVIQHAPENQNAVQQIIDTFPDVTVTSDTGDGFTVDVPSAYYGQWQAALMDNLPAGSEVFVPA